MARIIKTTQTMKKSFLQWHTQNGGEVFQTDGNTPENEQPKRVANPKLKEHNYIFANQIEVIEPEIVANKKIN